MSTRRGAPDGARTPIFGRGSEWRKWDLHIHIPGTKLSDDYERLDSGQHDWGRFADALEESDVAVFGLTDYFSADNTLDFIQFYQERFPHSQKLLLVNVELRLNEAVNKDVDEIDLHVIFRDSTSRDQISQFLGELKIIETDEKGRRPACNELSTSEQFERASVSRADIQQAFERTFGTSLRQEDAIFVAPANNSGIRAVSGNKRKGQIADEVDKLVDAIYGGAADTAQYFLRTDRFEETAHPSRPKPVFGGSDAHSFKQLERRLGKAVSEEGDRQVVTWIKADPTWEGLAQTLIEPDHRVSLEETKPDEKRTYQVISQVRFSGSNDFPKKIELNPNLCSIIGSRSSGKSALLAYIAHAVDPDGTEKIQRENSDRPPGPAAGLAWGDVSDTKCEVDWVSDEAETGQVVYIPQNYLYRLSEQPDEITRRIMPTLFRQYDDLKRQHDECSRVRDDSCSTIRSAIEDWEAAAGRIAAERNAIAQIGNRKAIEAEVESLQAKVAALRSDAEITDEELSEYQSIKKELAELEANSTRLTHDLTALAQYVRVGSEGAVDLVENAVRIQMTTRPAISDLPEALGERIQQIVGQAQQTAISQVETTLQGFAEELYNATVEATTTSRLLQDSNAELFEKYQKHSQLDKAINDRQGQEDRLARMAAHESRISTLQEAQQAAADRISTALDKIETSLTGLQSNFETSPRTLEDLAFDVEYAVPADQIEAASTAFNKNHSSQYISKASPTIDYQRAQSDPGSFLKHLTDGTLERNSGHAFVETASAVLTLVPQVRYGAILDRDRIGGFSASSMTPGKQALFALTLLLHELVEPWPLLIDQPEDDLDSRSIYEAIVPYLKERKSERQIIMVSHDANLVIGADTEQVIVANRQGDDRPNAEGRTFDYLTGSLEHSQPFTPTDTTLAERGIREHACEVLDGGEEAFEMRKNKYKI